MPLCHVPGQHEQLLRLRHGYGIGVYGAGDDACPIICVAQYLTRFGSDCSKGLTASLKLAARPGCRTSAWQPLRRCVEDMFVVQDPFELFVAQNLALDGWLFIR